MLILDGAGPSRKRQRESDATPVEQTEGGGNTQTTAGKHTYHSTHILLQNNVYSDKLVSMVTL